MKVVSRAGSLQWLLPHEAEMPIDSLN
jgi:hypothetical protein